MAFLSVSNISFQEAGHFGLHGVSFTQRQFQRIAIAGETGAGKSTLLQVVAGLASPSTGEVRFEGQLVEDPHEKLIPGHPGIAYLSQQFELPKFLRVEQVLRYADKLGAAEAQKLYELCQIDHLLPRKTNQLSGGERQRIALARLLLGAPRLLLLDEPFSNLDSAHKQTLKAVLRDVGAQLGLTYLLVSHDPLDTLSWADEILVLQAGRLVQQGPPEQLYRQPASEYVAALFGDYNVLAGAAARQFAAPAKARPAKQLLVRPEDFRLGPPEAGVPGTVTDVRFFGSYYEATVRLRGGATVRLRTAERGLQPGAAVGVRVAEEGGWLV
ncbi:ABC transporter ATP-binding protein [Hymenobacter sp. 15J16-1T3B]|uniref:ABC transporter ATP-binding protein n=1 Tax=Hymenobacter sp. 15J16-1T3B TaxID=2886941 RepID=UPI001D1300F4|nr:ABC transporter ATP-binding protein [Hymenobacter sp. 15J16-1T3B]MCC3160782.1 ABC transporter ATP-binding protein [Hymenobacter sp. 15J16-1T3B]